MDTTQRVAQPPRSARTPILKRLSTWIWLWPMALLLLFALIGPWLAPYSPTAVVALPDLAPDAQHWLGTDSAGLDVLSRVLAATRLNLTIGLLTALLATAAGAALALLVGSNEGKGGVLGTAARMVSRALDLFQAIPAIVVGLVLIALYGASVTSIIVTLSIILMPSQARLVRTEVLRVRQEAYLDAARVSGESELGLTFRHVLPNSVWPALENASVVFGQAIILTAAFGFLGVGLAPPTAEWGAMIFTGASSAIAGRWWSALFPAICLCLSVLIVSDFGRRLFDRRS